MQFASSKRFFTFNQKSACSRVENTFINTEIAGVCCCCFPRKSQDRPVFTLLLQTAEIEVLSQNFPPSSDRRCHRTAHGPSCIPPASWLFPAPWLSRSPCKPCKGSPPSLASPCFSLNPSSTVTNAQILERGKKNKLDIPGPAVPGVSQLWDGESSLLAGLFYYREVLDLM